MLAKQRNQKKEACLFIEFSRGYAFDYISTLQCDKSEVVNFKHSHSNLHKKKSNHIWQLAFVNFGPCLHSFTAL